MGLPTDTHLGFGSKASCFCASVAKPRQTQKSFAGKLRGRFKERARRGLFCSHPLWGGVASEDRPAASAISDAEAGVDVPAAMQPTKAMAQIAAVGLPLAAQYGCEFDGGRIANQARHWFFPRFAVAHPSRSQRCLSRGLRKILCAIRSLGRMPP